MALSRLAREFAAEIANHDWADAPYRADRAGHRRDRDTHAPMQVLTDRETDTVRLNVMWVAAQVLGHTDPNFSPTEFAAACGVYGVPDGWIYAGLRIQDGGLRIQDGRYARPGSWEVAEAS